MLLLHMLAACGQDLAAPPPKPISVPSPVRIPDGTVGIVRRAAGGGAEVVFPSIDSRDPSRDAPPPTVPVPDTLWVEWAGDLPAGVAATMDLTGLAWKVRCSGDGGTQFVITAPMPEAAAPAQAPDDERGGAAGFVVVGKTRPGRLPPPVNGAVRRLEAANIAALDEDEEKTRACASDTDMATVLVTPAGRFRVGCCER